MAFKSFLGAVAVLVFPLAAHAGCSDGDGRAAAQGGLESWKSWCEACQGTVMEGPRCQPGPNWGGRGSGGSTTGDPFVDLGIMMGQSLRKGLFGDPEAEARRRADREAAEQMERDEQARRAEREAQLNQERYQRLMGLLGGEGLTLKGLERNESLRLKSSTATFGSRGNPDRQSISLADLKIGERYESASTSDTSSFAQLNRAAYLSRAAAVAPNTEDKKIYAEAAFTAATGGFVPFEIPPDVPGIPATEVHVFEGLKQHYQEAKADVQAAEGQLRKVLYAKNEAEILRREAELNLKQERSKVPDQREPPSNDDKLAEAEQLLKEAMELETQVSDKLSQAEQDLGKARAGLEKAEQQTRGYIDELGKKGSAQTGQ